MKILEKWIENCKADICIWPDVVEEQNKVLDSVRNNMVDECQRNRNPNEVTVQVCYSQTVDRAIFLRPTNLKSFQSICDLPSNNVCTAPNTMWYNQRYKDKILLTLRKIRILSRQPKVVRTKCFQGFHGRRKTLAQLNSSENDRIIPFSAFLSRDKMGNRDEITSEGLYGYQNDRPTRPSSFPVEMNHFDDVIVIV